MHGQFSTHCKYFWCLSAGCLNGGGQIRPQADQSNKELLQQVEELYKEECPINPEEDERITELYHTWLEGVGEERARKLLHTQYHAVEKASTGLNIKW